MEIANAQRLANVIVEIIANARVAQNILKSKKLERRFT
jgi:hypothetical protein